MSELKEAIYDKLNDDADVSGLVGVRIFHTAADQGAALPYIVVQRVSTTRARHSESSGLPKALMQIKCWAATDAGAEALAEHVRDAMDTFTGAMGDDSLSVRDVVLENQADEYVEPRKGQRVGTFGQRLEFRITYDETGPNP